MQQDGRVDEMVNGGMRTRQLAEHTSYATVSTPHSLLEELGSPGNNRGILQGTHPEQTNAFYSNRFPFKDSLAGDLYKLLIPLCFFLLQVLGRVGGPGERVHASDIVPAHKGGWREREG